MKTSINCRHSRGFVSIVLVVAVGMLLLALTLYSYKRSLSSQSVEAKVQLSVDYAEREDAMLRAIVASTPNRAIQAMKTNSYAAATRDTLSWTQIFTDSVATANARNSISSDLLAKVKGSATTVTTGNSGDSTLTTNVGTIFGKISTDTTVTTGYVSTGLNRSLGTGYPVALNCADATTTARDMLYPIISPNKVYGALASGSVGLSTTDYSNLNVLTYPNINFGYTTPGSNFVAKRNWWAFNLGLGANDRASTSLAGNSRQFVLSIYEIPSQLAISSSAYMSLGTYGTTGETWKNVNIEGNVFAGKADLKGSIALTGLASRRGISNFESGSTVGGLSSSGSSMAAGVRESYQVTNGSFFPVSQASESGRVAFIPINRGNDFFDRFVTDTETADNAVSPNTFWSRFANITSERRSQWDNYSQGAVQCAMRLDVTKGTTSSINEVKFQYMKADGTMASTTVISGAFPSIPLDFGSAPKSYAEGASYTTTTPVDIAYGTTTQLVVKRKFTGTIVFSNAGFGSSITGTRKGYVSANTTTSLFVETKAISTGESDGSRSALVIYPQRIKAYLALLGVNSSNSMTTNNSLAVNVDYKTNTGSGYPTLAMVPNYAVVLDECSNLSDFTKGFSLVTNLRLYIADDFNTTAATAPSGYTGTYYPPCSLFAPEKRYGLSADPYSVSLTGQIGSVASDSATTAVSPLDSKNKSGGNMAASRMAVNLRPITHPADIPPISMMNWLVLLEEKSKQY